MVADKDQITSFTVRLPEILRKQLMVQAEGRSRSLNAHLQAILEGYLVESGFAGNRLISQAGRTFEIDFEYRDPGPHSGRAGVMGIFYLKEIKFDKNRAYFMIGLSEELTEDWRLEHRQEAIEQVGIALLNFYNKKMEIDQLRWPHPTPGETYDGYRVFTWKDVEPAQNLNQFLDLLRSGKWDDPKAEDAGQSQDIRRGRNPAELYR